MTHRANPVICEDIGSVIRQTADLRRLCISLHEAANRDGEEASLAAFTQALSAPSGLSNLPLGSLRAGFCSLWCQGRYAEIVTAAQRLLENQSKADEIVLMYALCAARKLEPRPRTPAA